MKRGAEKQKTRDDDDGGDDVEEDSPGQGFRKADESVLAARPMRGLPRRSAASTPTSTPPPTTGDASSESQSTPAPKFNAFSGFGTNSSSFAFNSPIFASSSTSPSPFSSITTPAVAPTASNATKTFASFVSSSSRPSDPVPQPSPVPSTTDSESTNPVAIKYYTSLRGINASLISAVTKAVEDDPFMDIADVLQQYKTLRLDAQKEFDNQNNPKFAMPTPPSSFFGGQGQTMSTASANPFSTGSKESAFTPLSSGFSFVTPPKAAASSPALPSISTSVFASAPKANLLEFKPPDSGVNSAIPADSDPKDKPKSAFGGFGQSSSTAETSRSLFGAPPTTPQSETTSPRLFTFGSGSGSGASNSGSGSGSPVFSGFGAFKKPGGGSIGNPVGFGFGSPPRDSETTNSAPASSGFNFGVPPPKPALALEKQKSDDSGDTDSGEGDDKTSAGDGVPPALLGTNPNDEVGEGEEDEETTHSIKVKAFKMKKDDESGKSSWAELGIGILRLKKHKTTGARRMLLRNSSTGKININFNIYAGLSPSLSSKTLTFIGHDAGAPQSYTLRLQNADQAKDLKAAVDREIAFVKAKLEAP